MANSNGGSNQNWLQMALNAVWSSTGLIGVVVVVIMVLVAWWLGFPIDEWLR